jgi:hypothetical protein
METAKFGQGIAVHQNEAGGVRYLGIIGDGQKGMFEKQAHKCN